MRRVALISRCMVPMLAVTSLVSAAVNPSPARPNIVFIMTDQQSADAMSFRMGDRYIKTPALDALAARGTYFSRAYAANPLCMPARNAIFTGRYPHQTGVTDNAPHWSGERLDPERFPTLGTYFQRAGYRTAYFGKWHLCYDAERPETHGFQKIDPQQKDAVTADLAVRFLGSKPPQPFLLVASFLNPHNVAELSRGQRLSNGPIGEPPPAKYLPPPPDNLDPPRNEPDTMTLIRRGYHASRLFPVGHFTPEMWQALRWGYYRLIEKVDAEIGRVLSALRAAGLEENTIVVFTSDHGECAGAHGFSQKTVFYEESARVPLIVAAPGQRDARVSDHFVNTGVDLLPTLLEYAGLPGPQDLPGASLRPLVAGEPARSWRDHVVVQNHMSQAGPVDGSVPIAQGRMVRTERFKYCVYEYGMARESLIDLESDPGEMHDLARNPAYRGVLDEHRARLRAFARQHADPLAEALLADGVAPRPFPHLPEPKNPRAAAARP